MFNKNFVLSSVFLVLSLLSFVGCREKKHSEALSTNSIRISIESDPSSLDPRLVRDLNTVTVLHTLYEGLTQTQDGGKTIPALAESFTVSPDKKTYTFHLRQSGWSNGDPVTAQDFEQSWKSTLDPKFPSPNAYQLYPIRGARAAKEGKLPLDQVGIHAPSPTTLIVELEHPTPYFTTLVSTHFFYPVHSSLRNISQEKTLENSKVITNGPFKVENWDIHKGKSAIPNPHYSQKNDVHIERIEFIQLDNPMAIQFYLNSELEWTGSPLSTLSTDALPTLKHMKDFHITPSAGVYFLRVNTEKAPFNHPKMRKAFALALNRGDLIEHVLLGNQIPALNLIPPSFLPSTASFKDNDVESARTLFHEALQEQSISINDLPSISILYASSERPHKIAQVAQQQWKAAFGIDITLQSNEAKVQYEKLKNHDYQLSIGSWFPDFHDPISYLEIFKQKDNGTNHTEWENTEFANLLKMSALTHTNEERIAILQQAQSLLMNEMPVIPLFFNAYNFLHTPQLEGVYFSELGYLDFKGAYFKEN